MPFIIVLSSGLLSVIFSWWPWTAVPFEVPKVVVFSVLTKILFLLFIFDLYKNPEKLKNWKTDKKLLAIILAFLVWSIIASLMGSDIPKSFLGNFYRRDGLITLFDLAGFSFLVSYFWKEKYARVISGVFYTSALVLSYLALFKLATGTFDLGAAVTFGNAVFLAGFLSVSLPFSYYFLTTFKKNYYLLLLIPQVLAIISIGAVSAIMTIILFAIVYLIVLNKGKLKIVYITTLLVFLISIFTLWAKEYASNNKISLVAEGRARIFMNLSQAILQRPLTGYGWSNVDYAFEKGSWPIKLNDDVYLDKAHSHFLEIAVTTGITGFILYLSLISLVMHKLIINYKQEENKIWYFTLISTLVLFVFHSQTNVISITEEIIFWFVVGLNPWIWKKSNSNS